MSLYKCVRVHSPTGMREILQRKLRAIQTPHKDRGKSAVVDSPIRLASAHLFIVSFDGASAYSHRANTVCP